MKIEFVVDRKVKEFSLEETVARPFPFVGPKLVIKLKLFTSYISIIIIFVNLRRVLHSKDFSHRGGRESLDTS
jgi:hypothetical protein